ncbi:hypothetical protein CXH38_17685 [Salmonella enterica]|nr:hypothetical protein [Salmonella enterica]
MSIKNDGHYFCRAGGNRPDGLNEPVTNFRQERNDQGRYNTAPITVRCRTQSCANQRPPGSRPDSIITPPDGILSSRTDIVSLAAAIIF